MRVTGRKSSKFNRLKHRNYCDGALDLASRVSDGHFRADLFYRLVTFQIKLPPLRERRADITATAHQFIKSMGEKYQNSIRFAEEAIRAFQEMPLKGNARKPRSIIERVFVTAIPRTIITADAIKVLALRNNDPGTLDDPWRQFDLQKEAAGYEQRLIERALADADGHMSGAAQLLGLSHQTLSAKIKNNYPSLMSARQHVRSRRKSIITKNYSAKKKRSM